MARNRKNKSKSKDEPADKSSQQHQNSTSAPKMAASKRSAEVVTNAPEDTSPQGEDQRPTQRQKTTNAVYDDGNDKPRFATRLLDKRQPPKASALTASAVDASHPLNPPHITALSQQYDVELFTVTRNANMKSKIRQLEQQLQVQRTHKSADRRGTFVAISAREDGTNKLLSIVEIVKRDLEGDKQPWFQYTAAWSRLELFSRPNAMEAKFGPGRRLRDGQILSDDEHGVEDDPMGETDAADRSEAVGRKTAVNDTSGQQFQVMEQLQQVRVRNIALITIYLSREAVPELRKLLGEQTSSKG